MSSTLLHSFFHIIFFVIIVVVVVVTASDDHVRPTKYQRSSRQLEHKKEKMSHLHFYFHDILSGRNPTAIKVAEAASMKNSPTGFGELAMMDDPLTEGPEMTSKVVGRAQGLYASVAQQQPKKLLVVVNFAFTDGKYNGSTLSILGRNPIFENVREMPVVGGTGLFRFARGYAMAHTHWFDLKTGDAVVEYHVHVMHY